MRLRVLCMVALLALGAPRSSSAAGSRDAQEVAAYAAVAALPSYSAVARELLAFRAIAGDPVAFGAVALELADASAAFFAVANSPSRATASQLDLVAQTSEEAELSAGFADPAQELLFADETPVEEDLLAGFDDPLAGDAATQLVERSGRVAAPDRLWDLGGSFTLGGAYNYAQDSPRRGEADYRGLSRLRVGLDLELDLKLPLGLSARVAGRGFRDVAYALKDRDEFTHEVLQLYEAELEFKELWLQGELGENIDFRVGRQVLAWGSSETLRVLDVLSPLDNREPGLIDLRDLRLPVAATRVSYFQGPIRLTGIAIHESRFDETPPFGSDFFPFDTRPPGEIRPANGGSDTEYGVALGGRFAAFDASLNWAQYFDDHPHLDRDSGLLEHSRLNLIGGSLDVPLGNWLVRGEVARIRGLEFFGARRKLSRSDLLVGLEYAGLSDAALTLEVVARKLHGYEDTIKRFPDAVRENSFEGSLRYTARYLNDRAELTALFIVFGQQAQDGTTLRVTFDYDLRGALTISAGVLVFEEVDLPPLSAADSNDPICVNLRYGF